MKTIIRSVILSLALSTFVSSCSRKQPEPAAQQEPVTETLWKAPTQESSNEDTLSLPVAASIVAAKEPVVAQEKIGISPAHGNPSGVLAAKAQMTTVREMEDVYNYLVLSRPPAGQSWQSFYARKNILMSRYASRSPLPAGYFDLIVGLAADKNAELVTRAYAIQHIARGLYVGLPEDGRRQVERVLEQAAMEHQSLIGGTSLLAAQYLWQKHDAFGKDWLIVAVRQTLADGQADRATRATALRLAGMLGDEVSVLEQVGSGRVMVGIEAATIGAAWRQLGLPGAPKCESCF